MTSTTTTSVTTGNKKPAATYRYGNVSAAVFREKTKDGTMMNVSVRRSYKDSSGAWQHTPILAPSDLLPAAFALTKCYEFIADAMKHKGE